MIEKTEGSLGDLWDSVKRTLSTFKKEIPVVHRLSNTEEKEMLFNSFTDASITLILNFTRHYKEKKYRPVFLIKIDAKILKI